MTCHCHKSLKTAEKRLSSHQNRVKHTPKQKCRTLADRMLLHMLIAIPDSDRAVDDVRQRLKTPEKRLSSHQNQTKTEM
jgi:hypothetical protein